MKNEYIDAKKPLNDVYQPAYDKIFDILKGMNRRFEFDSDEEYINALYVIGNHLYLIYERLYLNIVREIEYIDIKHFAINNNGFIKGIFKFNFPEFSIDSLNEWTRTKVDILKCSMYSMNNEYNKNIFH
jgi:hypothetical protein